MTDRLVALGMFVSGARVGFHWLEVPGEAHLVGRLDQEGNLEAGLGWISLLNKYLRGKKEFFQFLLGFLFFGELHI